MNELFNTCFLVGVTLFWIVLTLIFVDWKNWKTYYPTVLFICTINFINTIITSKYTLWHYEKTPLTPNSLTADFMVIFLNLTPMVLLFLSRYPYKSSFVKQGIYFMSWVTVNSILEAIFVSLHMMTYHHGWTYWWSVFLWAAMFILIRIHASNPLLAWLLCVFVTGFFIWHFRIPILSQAADSTSADFYMRISFGKSGRGTL
jgi:hypothetical protein